MAGVSGELGHKGHEADTGLELDPRAAQELDLTAVELDHDAADRAQATVEWERHSPLADQAHERAGAEREPVSRERDITAATRSRSAAHRITTAARRDEVAGIRDLAASTRDRAADRRDKAADVRDEVAEERERLALDAGAPPEAFASVRELRAAGATLRRRAALERAAASADREAAAKDRREAALDRRYAGLDELTGVFRRGTGELALAHEISRARRVGSPLVFAMLDVDRLKSVNDRYGHAAGDELLREVVLAVTSVMRAYDVTVRWGGDEFVCALSNATYAVAAGRLAGIQAALDANYPGASLSAGIVELNDGETLEAAIARADAALYRAKAERGR